MQVLSQDWKLYGHPDRSCWSISIKEDWKKYKVELYFILKPIFQTSIIFFKQSRHKTPMQAHLWGLTLSTLEKLIEEEATWFLDCSPDASGDCRAWSKSSHSGVSQVSKIRAPGMPTGLPGTCGLPHTPTSLLIRCRNPSLGFCSSVLPGGKAMFPFDSRVAPSQVAPKPDTSFESYLVGILDLPGPQGLLILPGILWVLAELCHWLLKNCRHLDIHCMLLVSDQQASWTLPV